MIKSKITTILELNQKQEVSCEYVALHKEYNKNGCLIHKTVYHPDGGIESNVLYKYDDKNNLLEQVEFAGDGRMVQRTDHFFDEQGNYLQAHITLSNGAKTIKEFYFDPEEKIEKTVLNTDSGEIKGYEVCWYGKEDEVIAEVKSDGNNRTRYKRFATYDGAGRVVVEEIFGMDEVFEKRISYAYLPNGRLGKVTIRNEKGKELAWESYEYDSQNRLIEKTGMDKSASTETKTKYRYDRKGYLISEKTYENGKLKFNNRFRYDTRGHVIEEKIIDASQPASCIIRKHQLQYWKYLNT